MNPLATSSKKLHTLFQAIGSEARLEEILFRFYQAQAQDLMIGFFFSGFDLQDIARRQTAFLLKAMGVHKTYNGKIPSKAHTKLPPIHRGHFDRRIQILKTVLVKEGLDENSIQVWMDLEESFREQVSTK